MLSCVTSKTIYIYELFEETIFVVTKIVVINLFVETNNQAKVHQYCL